MPNIIQALEIAQKLSVYYPATYPNGNDRRHHGMDHAIRAAIFGCAAYQMILLSKTHNTQVLSFDSCEFESQLVYIALLMHDSGRLNDGVDLWDEDSALHLFNVLTTQFKVEKNLAITVAESMANKDWKPGQHYSTLIFEGSTPKFLKDLKTDGLNSRSERLRLAIQFGDCIDIFRLTSENSFDWSYIDLYRETQNQQLKKVIEELLPQCFEFIDKTKERTVKENWSVEQFSEHIFQELNRDNNKAYPLLQHLFQPRPELSFNELPLSKDPIRRAFIRKELLFRGIENPSQIYVQHNLKKRNATPQTRVYFELWKTARRKHIPTRGGHLGKHGNLNRSMSLIGQGTNVFTPVGGGIFLDKTKLISFSPTNIRSGFGSKKEFNNAKRGDLDKIDPGYIETIKRMYGSGMLSMNREMSHSEAIGDVDHWDCIMYCTDATSRHKSSLNQLFLDAIYLRKAYFDVFPNSDPLPIYQFSGRTGFCKKIPVTEAATLDALSTCFYEKIEEMARRPQNSREIALITAEPLDIAKLVDYFYGVLSLNELSETITNNFMEQLKRDELKIKKTRDDILMGELRPRGQHELEFIYYLSCLHFQIKRGIDCSRQTDRLSFFIGQYFEDTSSYHCSPWVDLFAQLASYPAFNSEFLRQLSYATPRRFNDYLRLMSIVTPKEVTVEMLTNLMRRYIQCASEKINSCNVSTLLSIESCISSNGCIIFGDYYTQAMHESILEKLKPEETALLITPLKNHLNHYQFTFIGNRMLFSYEFGLMHIHAQLYSKPLPRFKLILLNFFISLFHPSNTYDTIARNMSELIKIYQAHPLIYAHQIIKAFAKVLQDQINGVGYCQNDDMNFSNIRNTNVLFQAMTLFTKRSENENINSFCQIIFTLLDRTIHEHQKYYPGESPELTLKLFLHWHADLRIGEFFTQDLHDKVMTNLTSEWDNQYRNLIDLHINSKKRKFSRI